MDKLTTPRAGRVAAVALGAALAVTACSSGSGSAKAGGTEVSTQGVLAGAYQSVLAVHSADLGLDLTVTPASGNSVHVTAAGAIQWKPLLGSFSLSIPLGSSGTTTLNYRLIGDNMYLEIPPSLAGQTGGKPWLEGSLSSLVSSGQVGEFNPADELAVLTAHATSVEKVGPATVGGQPTTEYSADLSLANMSGETALMQQLAPKLEQILGTDTLPVTVWIDHAGRLAQFAENLTLQHAPAGSSSQAAAAFPVKENLTETLSNYGATVTVTAPPAAQTQQIDLSQLLQSAGV